MILLEQAQKNAKIDGRPNRIILACDRLAIPSDQPIALLGPSAKEKRLLIDVLAGTATLTRGRIIRKVRLSFPVGVLPSIEKELSVRSNIGHIARLYGANPDQTVAFVRTVIDIGRHFDEPMSKLPPEVRKPLAKIVAYSLPFDAYLLADDKIDNDQAYSEKCLAAFKSRLSKAGMIIPTQNLNFAYTYCKMAIVLFNGQLRLFENIDEGIAVAKALPQEHD